MKKTKLRVSLLAVLLVVATLFAGCSKKEAKEYEKGTINGDSFESEFLNMKFTAPEGYTLFPQDVMDQYVQFASEIVYKDQDQKVIDYTKAITLFEMMCGESTANIPNINIVIENQMGEDISIDDYIENYKEQLKSTGNEYTFDDIRKDVELAGAKYTVLDFVGDYSGQELLQQVYFRKVGDRMMALTVTYSEDTVDAKDTLLGGFTAYK